MNYLAHFVYNHDIRSLPCEPYFVMGVALPDLWSRYSRSRRIRWRVVNSAVVAAPPEVQLRDGLLNHLAADQQFHGAVTFRRWQGELKQAVPAGDVHPALVDFLTHVSIELVLDAHLMHADDDLVETFYNVVARCDPIVVEQAIATVADVATDGLRDVIQQFVARRFLHNYRTPAGLADVVRIILTLASIPLPPEKYVDDVLRAARERVTPEQVWAELAGRDPARMQRRNNWREHKDTAVQ